MPTKCAFNPFVPNAPPTPLPPENINGLKQGALGTNGLTEHGIIAQMLLITVLSLDATDCCSYIFTSTSGLFKSTKV